MTDEKLIEDAKRVMAEADGQDVKRMDAHTLEFMYGGQARAALAVFEKAHTPTDDEREVHRRVIDLWFANWRSIGKVSPALEVAIDSLEGMVSDALDAGSQRSEVPEPSAGEKIEWPDHWTTNEKIRDLHARWHDQAGNLIEVCGWEGCEFWEAAKFTLRMADVRVIGREPQDEPSDAPTVQFVARKGGKSQALIDQMLEQANDQGIRVEVVYPQGEPSDAQDDSERRAAYRREHRAELMRQERAALRAAGGERR